MVQIIYRIVLWTFVFCHYTWSQVDHCNNNLGMKSGRIPDESITASSAKSDDHAPSFARIDNANAWCSAPEDESPYIEIILEEQTLITAITTQGSSSEMSWARKYEVKYMEKGKWKPYKEELKGNENIGALNRNELDPAIRTQKIRIYPKEPLSAWPVDHVPSCLRLELYGCSAPACPFVKGEVCEPNGHCNRDPGALYPCVCFSGYQWNDSSSLCEDADECLLNSHLCLPPTICINTPGSYRCKCPSLLGWSFDGRTCNDIDECQYPNVCDPQATCINFPGGFNCSCNLGWRGQGPHSICSDINECAEGTDKCPNPSKCVNTLGSYYCVCDPGWEQVSEFQCIEIDECSRGIDGCDPNSACVNTPGSWKCTCNNGWYPYPSNARLPTCKDVNECVEDPNVCPVQSLCVNSVGSYHCNCFAGRRNRGPHACDDIDECYDGSHSCPSNSRCINTQGSYQCRCNSGYTPPITTTTCNDVNECAVGTHSCSSHSYTRCVNSIGSYTCQCLRCYFMSGNRCHPDCRLVTQYYYVTTYTSYTTYYTTSCGWLGLGRCRRSRLKQKSKARRGSRTVWVANRHGASCPCQ